LKLPLAFKIFQKKEARGRLQARLKSDLIYLPYYAKKNKSYNIPLNETFTLQEFKVTQKKSLDLFQKEIRRNALKPLECLGKMESSW
jgi:transposase-like protein